MSPALQTLLIVVLIGIVAGWLITRYGRGWFKTRASDLTAALVGIAGAFIGFHVGAVIGLRSPLMDYIAAIVGAFIILWLWKNR
ncbi:MAG: transglycosylase [Rhodomicrobium sp.]